MTTPVIHKISLDLTHARMTYIYEGGNSRYTRDSAYATGIKDIPWRRNNWRTRSLRGIDANRIA